MKRLPELLKKGDLIQILAPAKAIEKIHVEFAKTFLQEKGFEVNVSENCLGQFNYFSGTIEERISDFQQAVDNPKIKAILCARGGYGSVQLLDSIDWSSFNAKPKWIIGFSDITVFHQFLSKKGIASLHASMPLNFKENSCEALDSILQTLTNGEIAYEIPNTEYNIQGKAKGVLEGGNLSIIYSLLGTNAQASFKGCILFIEDLCEHLYAIDRIFFALKLSGVLNDIKGLVIGGMTKLMDTENPFGMNYQQIILSHTKDLDIPVAFEFPAGHINDNRALILGRQIILEVKDQKTKLLATK